MDNDLKFSISVTLFGFGLAALMVLMYRCIVNPRRAIAAIQRPRPANNNAETPSSIEISTAQLIPAYKYYKGMGLVGDDGDTCVICLGEFREGEELRTLPECLHSYHVPCIDMWFHSHSDCPMCRTDAMSTPYDLSHLTEFNSHGSEAHQNLGMSQSVAVAHQEVM